MHPDPRPAGRRQEARGSGCGGGLSRIHAAGLAGGRHPAEFSHVPNERVVGAAGADSSAGVPYFGAVITGAFVRSGQLIFQAVTISPPNPVA